MATDDAFAAALRAAYVALTPGGDRAVPGVSIGNRQSVELGTDRIEKKQILKSSGTRVPGVLSENRIDLHRTASPETNALADAWASWVERAAVREYCGGMTRAEAEVRTALELGLCPRDPGID